jgi:hypothetical protein
MSHIEAVQGRRKEMDTTSSRDGVEVLLNRSDDDPALRWHTRFHYISTPSTSAARA